jgi:hypothetical protein
MRSAPTCHVTNVRPSINSPHLAVIPRNTPEYQCRWFQFYRASNFYCMAIAAESSSPTGLPLAAYWVAVGVAAALETSVNAAAVVAVCHASTESSSPSGRRAIRTRGARREAVSRQDVEAPVSGRCRRDERQCDNQPDERHERGRWRRKQQQLQLCNNQQKRNGTKTPSLSRREVVA